MSCVTCDGPQALPPTHAQIIINAQPTHHIPTDIRAHISARFGDTIAPGSMVVLWRGTDVTAQTVEAFAGPEGVGWVELRTMPEPGHYVIHPALYRCRVPDCRNDSDIPDWADPDPRCPVCGNDAQPALVFEAHVQTVIRHGATMIVRGVTLTTHPARRPDDDGRPGFTGLDPDQLIRDKIQAMVADGLDLPPDGGSVTVALPPADPAVWGQDRGSLEEADEQARLDSAVEQLRALGWTIEAPAVDDRPADPGPS